MVVPLPCKNPDTVILTNFLLWGPIITHIEQNSRPGRSIRYLWPSALTGKDVPAKLGVLANTHSPRSVPPSSPVATRPPCHPPSLSSPALWALYQLMRSNSSFQDIQGMSQQWVLHGGRDAPRPDSPARPRAPHSLTHCPLLVTES